MDFIILEELNRQLVEETAEINHLEDLLSDTKDATLQIYLSSILFIRCARRRWLENMINKIEDLV